MNNLSLMLINIINVYFFLLEFAVQRMEGTDDHEEDTMRFDFKDLLDQQKALEYQLNHLAAQRSDFVKVYIIYCRLFLY